MTPAYTITPAQEAQCIMSNCRRRAPADEAFCSIHRRPEGPTLLERTRWYLADHLEAREHSDGRELLNEVDAALTAPAQVDVAHAELRVAIQRGLLAELGDAYDCTRVWSAWGYGTMDENDFVPVLDRLEELISTIANEIAAIQAEQGA